MISCDNLCKTFKNKNRLVKAVNNVNFSIQKGSLVGLLGPNGAGKTTTIKCICRLINPTSGKIFIDKIDIIKNQRYAFNKIAAVLEGNRNIYWRLTVMENLQFFSGLHGFSIKETKTECNKLIEFFDLQDKVNVQVRFISRGMQQKLAIACTLMKKTDILLLDEPTVGLDVEKTYEIQNLLKQMALNENKTILLSSHNLQVVENVCERVIIINNGNIIADEKLENIKKLHQTRNYHIDLETEISENLKNILNNTFADSKILIRSNGKNGSEINIELINSCMIYQLLDLLRTNGSVINTIQNLEPTLENIYLKLIKYDK